MSEQYLYGVWCSVNGGQLCGCAKQNSAERQEEIQLLIDNKHRINMATVSRASEPEVLDKLVALVKRKIAAEVKKVLTKEKKIKLKPSAVKIEAGGFTPEAILAQLAYEQVRSTQQHYQAQ